MARRQDVVFASGRRIAIFRAMRFSATASTWLACALAASAVAAVTGLAFAGWLRHGAGIFLAMAENGLSWCF